MLTSINEIGRYIEYMSGEDSLKRVVHVKSDDGISISIEDLFVYAQELADLKNDYPDIFINAKKSINQPIASSNQHQLTDPVEIIQQLTEKMKSTSLLIPDRARLTALIEVLQGKTLADAYRTANTNTKTENSNALTKQGRKYCDEAHKIAATKLAVFFDIGITSRKKIKLSP